MDRSGLRGSSLFVFRFSCLCTRVQCWRELVIACVKFKSWLIVRSRATRVDRRSPIHGFVTRTTRPPKDFIVVIFDYWQFLIPACLLDFIS